MSPSYARRAFIECSARLGNALAAASCWRNALHAARRARARAPTRSRGGACCSPVCCLAWPLSPMPRLRAWTHATLANACARSRARGGTSVQGGTFSRGAGRPATRGTPRSAPRAPAARSRGRLSLTHAAAPFTVVYQPAQPARASSANTSMVRRRSSAKTPGIWARARVTLLRAPTLSLIHI